MGFDSAEAVMQVYAIHKTPLFLQNGIAILFSEFLHLSLFNMCHCMQTFLPNFCILVTLIGTVDLYHFISLSEIFTLVADHKISRKLDLQTSLILVVHF